MENFSTHAPHKISTAEWQGHEPAKFKGGRFHQNHPNDELDTLLMGANSSELQKQGKKQFYSSMKSGKQPDFKPQLKVFDQKYKRSTVFDEEKITR
jgi:ribosomal protein L33